MLTKKNKNIQNKKKRALARERIMAKKRKEKEKKIASLFALCARVHHDKLYFTREQNKTKEKINSTVFSFFFLAKEKTKEKNTKAHDSNICIYIYIENIQYIYILDRTRLHMSYNLNIYIMCV
jgi:hypothetical protein